MRAGRPARRWRSAKAGPPARDDEPSTRRVADATRPRRGRTNEATRRTLRGPLAAGRRPSGRSRTARPHVQGDGKAGAEACTSKTGARRVRRVLRAALLLLALVIVANELADRVARGAAGGQGTDSGTERSRRGVAAVPGAEHSQPGNRHLRARACARAARRSTADGSGDRQLPDAVAVGEGGAMESGEQRARPRARGARRRSQLRAALRYCDGHLHRIDGEARKAGNCLQKRSTSLRMRSSPSGKRRELRPRLAGPLPGPDANVHLWPGRCRARRGRAGAGAAARVHAGRSRDGAAGGGPSRARRDARPFRARAVRHGAGAPVSESRGRRVPAGARLLLARCRRSATPRGSCERRSVRLRRPNSASRAARH